jgi:serpin B
MQSQFGPRELKAIQERLHSSHGQFAFDFFTTVISEEGKTAGNVVVSPVSAFIALQLVAEAMQEADRKEILSRLHLTWGEPEIVREATKVFRNAAEVMTEETQVITANSVWFAPGNQVDSGYRTLAERFYGADVLALHSIEDADEWCNRRTRGMIPRSAIQEVKEALILNVVYFNSKWKSKFDPELTREREFVTASFDHISCKFMHSEDGYYYYKTDMFEIVSIPYKVDRLSFYAIKSTNGDLRRILTNFTPEWWQEALSKMMYARVRLAMPRFNFRFRRKLNTAIDLLGFGSIFARNPGKISGIRNSRGETLSFEEVVQEAVIDLEEEGTKASAVTAALMGPGSVQSRQDEYVNMVLDSPFAFIIGDILTGVPLFMGVVANPLEV